MNPGATRTTVSRRILADPTSTALLLAAPSAFELWPGVHTVTAADGRAVVEADLPSRAAACAVVRALPPHRTPTSFVSRFGWSGPDLPETSGELTLRTLADPDGAVVTQATLVLDSAAQVADLRAMASGFLANLARAAELRSRAA